MKPWIIILLCFVCACLIYGLGLNFAKDPVETRYLEYKGCKVSYYYSSTDFFFSNHQTRGHGMRNWTEELYAENELIKCLCEKYILTKDNDIKTRILKYYNSDKSFKYKYSSIRYYSLPPIDTIIKYGHKVFRNDTSLFNQFVKYKTTKDYRIAIFLYEKYKSDSALFYNDYEVLNNIRERTDTPTIDSICKYKERIFGIFYRVPE